MKSKDLVLELMKRTANLTRIKDLFPDVDKESKDEMVLRGITKSRRQVRSAQERGAESETCYGQVLLREGIPAMVDGLKEWLKTRKRYAKHSEAYKVLSDMDPKVVCFLAVKSIVDVLSQRRSLASASVRLGAILEDECRFGMFAEQHPEFDLVQKGASKRPNYTKKRYYLRKSMEGETAKGNVDEWQRWGTRLKGQVGTVLIMLMADTTGLIEFVKINVSRTAKGPTRFLQPTKETEEWITESIRRNELLQPFWLPLKTYPKPWDNVWSGGYEAEAGLPPMPFIKLRNKAYLRQVEDMPLDGPFATLNHLQDTAWEVNPHTYELLNDVWERDIQLGELPAQADVPLPPYLAHYDEDPVAKRDWKREAASIYDHNASTKSRRILTLNTISLAKRFLGETFYQPHQFDFRGRAYAVPSYLNHMGPDFAKGLVRFAKSETVRTDEDMSWLYIHGANTFGIKGTYEDRIQWVEDNKQAILHVAKSSPDFDMLREADEPFQFSAFCWEFRKLHDTWDNGFETKLPCQMDASNNGLQILGMLTRDRSSCEATNVSANTTPQDIYQRVMDVALAELLNEEHISPFAKPWLQFGLDRGCAKRPTMTQPYGSTRHACRQYVNQWYMDKVRNGRADPFDSGNRFEACSYLAMKVWRAIETVVGRPRQAMDWLQRVARLLAGHEKPLEWVTPSGFPVMQAYEKFAEKSIRTKVGDKVFRVKFREDIGKLSARRQAQGSSPNFVHSLDASVLHMTVQDCASQGITSFSMVHDSYGTHSNKCPLLADAIRQNVYRIFSVDQLDAFRNALSQRYELSLPDLPEYGSFDIEEVLSSLYMFS